MKHIAVKNCSNCSRVFRGEVDILKHTSRWRVCENDCFWFDCGCGEALALKPNEVEWFNPKGGHRGLLSALADRKEFPRLPQSLFWLLEVLEDDSAHAKDIASVSRKDPLTAAGILMIANRIRKNRGLRIDSLEHAVTYIGRDMVKLIALTSALGSLKFMTSQYSPYKFWNEAFLTGAVCEALAPSLAPKVSADEAYIAGALCNVGKVVNAIFVPQVMDRIFIATSEENGHQWEFAERQITAFAHTKSGALAGTEWGLPEFVIDAIREHHSLPKFGIDRSGGLSLVELVGFSNQIAHAAARRLHRIDKDIFNSFASICSFTKDDIKLILADLQPTVADVKVIARDFARH